VLNSGLNRELAQAQRTIVISEAKQIARRVVRPLVLAACAALAACAGAGSEDGSLAATSAPRPAAAARGTAAPWVPPEPAVAEAAPTLTVERAREQCWVGLDRDRRAPRDLDRRVKLVEACVDARMKAAAQDSAVTP